MELFMNLMYILVTSVLVENVVLAKFLGCCPFLGVSKKLDSAVGMSSAVIFVMLMATAVTWPIYTYLLAPQGLDYLQTIVFILVIAALVQLVEFILKKYMKPLYRSLGVYLPLILGYVSCKPELLPLRTTGISTEHIPALTARVPFAPSLSAATNVPFWSSVPIDAPSLTNVHL